MALFARDCDLLIHDAQYTTEDYMCSYAPKQGFGHSTYEMAIETYNLAKAKFQDYRYDTSKKHALEKNQVKEMLFIFL